MFDYRVGRVQKPHGLEGDLHIKLFRPRRDRSHQRRPVKGEVRVALTGDDDSELVFVLASVRFIDSTRVVLKFDGMDRALAETLGGRYLDLDSTDLPAVLTDFADRAFGLDAVNQDDGTTLGKIVDLRDNGAQPLIIIETADEIEVLVPYVDAFVVGVQEDGDKRVLALTNVAGFLDL